MARLKSEDRKKSETVDKKTVSDKKRIEVDKTFSVVFLREALQVFRLFFVVSVVLLVVLLFATWIIPSFGETMIVANGIDETWSFASVMATWLVPQLFVAALCAILVWRFARWFWQSSGRWCVDGFAKFRSWREARLKKAESKALSKKH